MYHPNIVFNLHFFDVYKCFEFRPVLKFVVWYRVNYAIEFHKLISESANAQWDDAVPEIWLSRQLFTVNKMFVLAIDLVTVLADDKFKSVANSALCPWLDRISIFTFFSTPFTKDIFSRVV